MSPHDSLSYSDSLDVDLKAHFDPKGNESPATLEKTTQDQIISPTTQVPARSTLASINIVAACTSSVMITTALGPAVTISLSYVGEDLHIRKNDLQWILSAYSISSVRISYFICNIVSTQIGMVYHACTGLLPPSLGATRGSVWTQTRLDHRIFDHRDMLSYLVLCTMYVRFDLTAIIHDFFFLIFWYKRVAGLALDIMRGIQGIGAAAMIPSSVRLFLVVDSPILK
jgi:hypothetical protein